jgi:hypothetical protein
MSIGGEVEKAQASVGRWLKILDPEIDAADISKRVRERLVSRESTSVSLPKDPNPAGLVQRLRWEMIESHASTWDSALRSDCDIVPRDYTIDWRVPILGPIHALVRRLINAEIRRYLMPALEKQSYLNRQFLRTLNELRQENHRLRRRIEELQEERESAGP